MTTMRVLPVLVMGSCPGIGKTSLVETLVSRLQGDGKTVGWFPEEAVLEHTAFTQVARTFRQTGLVVPEELLAASDAYVQSWSKSDADILLVDSLFPFVNSLLASGFGESEVEAFVGELWKVLQPTRPLTIYVDGDPSIALQRAHAVRGDKWLDSWVRRVRQWRLEPKLQDVKAITRHFQHERSFTQQLLSTLDWSFARLDSETASAGTLSATAYDVVIGECVRRATTA